MCTRTEIHNLKITVRSRQITFLCLRLFIMYMGCGYVCGSVSLYRWINVHVCHSFSIILPEEKAEWIMAILFHAEHLKSLRRAAILSFSFFSPPLSFSIAIYQSLFLFSLYLILTSVWDEKIGHLQYSVFVIYSWLIFLFCQKN